MSTGRIFYFLAVEAVKYLIVSYGILGFRTRESRLRFLVLLYPAVGVFGTLFFGGDTLVYDTLWGLALLIFWFEGRISKKLQAFLMEYMAINMLDILASSVLLNTIYKEKSYNSFQMECTSEIIGILLCAVLAALLHGKRNQIRRGFEDLSWRYYVLLLSVLIGMSVIVATVQIELMDVRISDRILKVLLFACVAVMFVMTAVIGIFMYLLSQKKEKERREYENQREMERQRGYYEKLYKRDGEIVQINHDIRKHFRTLQCLCDEGDLGAVQDYLTEVVGRYEGGRMYHTGNRIADYFLNGVVFELRDAGSFDCEVYGVLPEEFRLADWDASVLFGNALMNAQEALQEVEGRRYLGWKTYRDEREVCIEITNTVKGTPDFKTHKADKRKHGYGIRSMRRVVEEYGGSIRWSQERGRVILMIKLPFVIKNARSS